ncbi:MAG: competence/damage-inducible protein A, partial [Armatimonadetes bacterium]|nr:competence/damage-inducible protein A [Armatimonadota bacterium]
SALGIDHYFSTVVGDNLARIREALAQARSRSEIVITTGGIGPTLDDVTRQAVADVMGVELEFHQHLMDHI